MSSYSQTYCIGNPTPQVELPSTGWGGGGRPIPSWLILDTIGEKQYFTWNITTEGLYTFTLVNGEESFEITILSIDCEGIERDCVNSGCTTNIAWLNLEGGWSSYVFASARDKKEFVKDIGDSIDFKVYDSNTGDRTLQTTQINDVYDREVVSSGYIPLKHLHFVEALKYSIVQYLYNEDMARWNIPIVINKESFTLKRCNNGFVEYNFSFRYAKQIIIQTQ